MADGRPPVLFLGGWPPPSAAGLRVRMLVLINHNSRVFDQRACCADNRFAAIAATHARIVSLQSQSHSGHPNTKAQASPTTGFR